MQLNRAIIAFLLATIISANVYAQQTDSNDISAYYGFGEIEIIKLDWGITNLTVADFNGDGRNDIAVVNNSKAKIELLIHQLDMVQLIMMYWQLVMLIKYQIF